MQSSSASYNKLSDGGGSPSGKTRPSKATVTIPYETITTIKGAGKRRVRLSSPVDVEITVIYYIQ